MSASSMLNMLASIGLFCRVWPDVASVRLSLDLLALCVAGSDVLPSSANAGDWIRPTDITIESAMEMTQEAGLRITAPSL